MKHQWIRLLYVVFFLLAATPAAAQESTPVSPVYVVQDGDNLWDVAVRFGVTLDELLAANNLTQESVIYPGIQLVIPGLSGITGTLTTQEVAFGETLNSLSLRYQTPVDILARLNHLTSPIEVYAGMSLVIPLTGDIPEPGLRLSLVSGQSLLEKAVLNNSSPYSLALKNSLSNTSTALPGTVYRLAGVGDPGPGALPPEIAAVGITSFVQGETSLVRVDGVHGLRLSGSLMDHPLNFFELPEGGYVALQGVHAMEKPGVYPLTMQGSLPDGSSFGFTQLIRVFAGDFLLDYPLTVAAETIDPAVTGPENELWANLTSPATTPRQWEGIFSLPADPPYADCITSRFGSRRSYNGSEYIYFHTGLDYCNGSGSSVYAAAPGKVVFANGLDVRGCTILIDHGWGVYTAYMHLQDDDAGDRVTGECSGIGILANEGEQVESGQLIGITGGTGRVEGPHLHFELLVGGVQVNPLQWLAQEYP